MEAIFFTGTPQYEMNHCSFEYSMESLWLSSVPILLITLFSFSQILALFALTFWKIHER